MAKVKVSALEKIEVLYQDDRDDNHPDRWRIYQYRIRDGRLEILVKSEWHFVGFSESLSNLQEFGYTHSIYGFLSKEPCAPPAGFSSRPKVFSQFRFLKTQCYGPACSVLGINWPVNRVELKRAYREKSKQVHPDAGGSAEEFNAVQEAYELLLETVKPEAAA
ncbi:MAG: DnaJ domain-containing protein [Cyanobacteria bacterium P01_F01_bin.86]